jgi:hypothetical protein
MNKVEDPWTRSKKNFRPPNFKTIPQHYFPPCETSKITRRKFKISNFQNMKMLRVTQPHDCIDFIWDELKFIPIIESPIGIEVGSFFFSLIYFKAIHKKNLFSYPNISTPTIYLTLHLPSSPHQKPKSRRIQTLSL